MNDSTAVPATPGRRDFPHFHRARRDRMIAGVCRGVEDSYGIDAPLSRVVLIVTTVLGFGIGILVYLACWIIVPLEPEPTPGAHTPAAPTGPDPESRR